MKVPLFVVIIAVVIFGFLIGSTVYFYDQTRQAVAKKSSSTTGFVGPVVQAPASNQPNPIDQYTQPASPRGRLSYPANVYTIGNGQSLASIAAKLAIDKQYIIKANSIANEDSIQSGQVLAIPKLNTTTYYYRLNFIVDDNAAAQTVISQRTNFNSDLTDPVKVAKSNAVGYYNITNASSFTLASQDESKGQATVAIKEATYTAVVGLVQPKTIGKDGFWAIAYIEEQDNPTSN